MKRALMSLAVLVSTAVAWAVPQLINYQGQLTNSSGAPLDTTLAMTFQLYSDSTTGSSLWAETQPSVSVSGGRFQVRLGQMSSLPGSVLNQSQVWLGITVGGDSEMAPRTRIVSTPYSYRVGTVDGASGGSVSGKLNVGSENTNPGNFAFVVGNQNSANSLYSSVTGGFLNQALGQSTHVGGGQNNRAGDGVGTNQTVGGGAFNYAGANGSVVAGGVQDSTLGNFGTIAGGAVNVAAGVSSTVGGGQWNRARGQYSVIAGGGGSADYDSNSALGNYSVIGGGARNVANGELNTISGGLENRATGSYSTIPGGILNTAFGYCSFAAGYHAKANHDGAFVWGGDAFDSTASFASNTFTARCANGARFYTTLGGTATGVQLPAGGGAWSSLCDVNQKNLHGRLNTADVLQKVADLPLYDWSYKSQDNRIRHAGPTAQDFYATFGLGDNNTTISTLDPDGVALAAIQELAKENNGMRSQIALLKAQVQNLMAGQQHSAR